MTKQTANIAAIMIVPQHHDNVMLALALFVRLIQGISPFTQYPTSLTAENSFPPEGIHATVTE